MSDWIKCNIEMFVKSSDDDVNAKVLRDLNITVDEPIEFMPAKLTFRKSDVTHIREVLQADGSSDAGFSLVYLRCGDNYVIDIDYEQLGLLLDAHN